MRKYIFSILLIISGLILLILNYTNKKAAEYSEKAFSLQALNFEKAFDNFTQQVNKSTLEVKNHFSDSLTVMDSVQSRTFCINLLEKNPSITSIGFFQNKLKVIARKENTSFVYAVNSSDTLSVVKWQRFDKGKHVSSWFESFDISIFDLPWYDELVKNNDQLHWYMGNRIKTNPDEKDDDTFFYTGYSYSVKDQQSVILLEYSRTELLKGFNIASRHIKPLLSFRDLGGKELNLSTASEQLIPLDSTKNDSLQINITNHFSKFKDIPQGIFNFKYKNEFYWNSFKRLPEESGIKYYLFTIPNSDLNANYKSYLGGYQFWAAIILILSGVLLLAVRKRFFYKPNRMTIPSIDKILEKDENRYLEFKSSLRWDYRQEKTNPELEKVVMKTLAAFGNTDGGMLLIGVDDDKNVLGLKKDFQTLKKSDADYYEVHLRNLLHKMMGVKYVSKFIRTQFEELNNKTVCKVKVLPADEPLYLKYKDKNGQLLEKFYVRSGNSSHEIESIAEINDYINTKFK